ncbi:hypothetical protein [Cellulomonas aerilata]|uniref:Uncharacterized protein n=1 Tax=Cellulomonas aerilata TaxID=515326 RepID=A0A512DCE0_9CELL|nr:hypothetical protein [Cellulomonas aerilata]GEO34126.1 hypothetical protein CAE01nite_18510 [Cellulomonas aerilata]
MAHKTAALVLAVAAAVVTAGFSTADQRSTQVPAPVVTEEVPAPVVAEPAQRPLLLKHGWDIPTPRFVAENAAAMAASPFDGVVVTAPGVSSKVMRQAPLSLDHARAVLAPMVAARTTRMSHNFVIVYATPAGPFSGSWTTPVANFGAVARAASEAGAEGIFFDVESYFGSSWSRWTVCPRLTDEQCADVARERGAQTMRAMVEAAPGLTVLTSFGAWASDPSTDDALEDVPYNDISRPLAVRGHFLIGMVEAARATGSSFADGGELYTLRSPEEFRAARAWLDTGLPSEGDIVPPGLRADYAATVDVSFGVYDRPWLGRPMDTALWQTTLENALDHSERYVWAYTERHDWWGTGWPEEPVPQAWVDATRRARDSG